MTELETAVDERLNRAVEAVRSGNGAAGPDGSERDYWPQPLVWVFLGGVREWAERIGRKHER